MLLNLNKKKTIFSGTCFHVIIILISDSLRVCMYARSKLYTLNTYGHVFQKRASYNSILPIDIIELMIMMMADDI